MKNKGPGRAYYALPPQPGALFGREKDVAKVVACLEGKGRVVVVTGGPGEGKLAVASQALKQLYEQKKAVGGVWHCNLTGVTHEEGMLIRQAFRKGLASLSPVTCRRTSLCSAPLLLGLCRELPSPVFNDVSPPPSLVPSLSGQSGPGPDKADKGYRPERRDPELLPCQAQRDGCTLDTGEIYCAHHALIHIRRYHSHTHMVTVWRGLGPDHTAPSTPCPLTGTYSYLLT